VKRFYVFHDDAEDLGLRAPQFATRAEAEARRDEWNKEYPGHKVLEIEEDDTASAEALPRREATYPARGCSPSCSGGCKCSR
jgi:hypothetical protein